MRRFLNGPMLIALVLGVLGGGAVYVSASDGAAQGASELSVVVMVRDVPVGQRIDAADVRLATLGSAGALADHLATGLDEVVGAYALLPLSVGEPLIRAKVGTEPPGSGLAVLIPAGRVAISVAVNDVIRTGGFIAPGDRVDVFGVITKEAGDPAELVISDVQVLAVSRSIVGSEQTGGERSSDDNPRSLDSTVTLAVTSEEAKRLVQVDELGSLRLALRPRAEGVGAPGAVAKNE